MKYEEEQYMEEQILTTYNEFDHRFDHHDGENGHVKNFAHICRNPSTKQ